MFNPEKEDYPPNAAGQPEFASIIVTIDAVTQNEGLGDDVVQKIVLSTQNVVTALTALAAYFGEPGLLSQPSNAQLLVESGRQANPVFVYTTPRDGTIQVLMSTPTWDMLVQSPSFGNTSALLCSDKVQQVVAQVQGDMKQFAGGFAPLLLLDLTPTDPDGGEAESSDAERLVETAQVQPV